MDIALLIMQDGKSLNANVYSINDEQLGLHFFKQYTENAFTKLLQGPVGFIEKVAKIADKQAAKMSRIKASEYDDIFSKMK